MILLELSARMSAANAAIHKKMYESGHLSDLVSRMAALITSNEEMKDLIKIVKSLEESGLLIKEISKTIKNEAKEQKGEKCY